MRCSTASHRWGCASIPWWPDVLAERLVHAGRQVAVLNQGIGGNRLLHGRRGSKALDRFDRDVLSLNGVKHLILLEGINDILWPNTVLAGPDEIVTAPQIIGALHQLLIRARMSGIKIMLGTIMPFEGALPESPSGNYYSPGKERIRQTVNQFIREESGADALVDFDALVRDPSRPARLLPTYECGDHLHPNDAGYRAMAEAIDLSFFLRGGRQIEFLERIRLRSR